VPKVNTILTEDAGTASTRNALEDRADIFAYITTAASVHHFQVVRCQATLTRVDRVDVIRTANGNPRVGGLLQNSSDVA
jgi:hypothetical protein